MAKYCIYHRVDWDGVMSAAIVLKKYSDVHLIGYNYGDSLDAINEIPNNSAVFMCDVSLPKEDMLALNKRTNLLWLDHHAKVIKDPDLKHIKGSKDRTVNHAGCMITHDVFFPLSTIPIAVRLLSLYDTWNHNDVRFDWDKAVFPFQMAMRQHELNPRSKFLQDLLNLNKFKRDSINTMVRDIINEGNAIIRYEVQRAKSLCESKSYNFVLKIKDKKYNVMCINTPSIPTNLIEPFFDREKQDFICTYTFDGSIYTHSLRLPEKAKKFIDVSEIARRFGGGGHPKAAGFRSLKSPFIPNV